MQLPNEHELILHIALSGDEKAFRSFFLHHYPALLKFAHSILLSPPLAEEVVSDVFLNVWQQRSRLPQVENIRLYLYVSVRNRSLTALEKLRRERAVWIEESRVDVYSLYPDPERAMISSETLVSIRRAVEALPPKCRMIFKLVKEDGLSYKETADVLELSVKTIENQMGIALKKMAEALGIRTDASSQK